MPKNQGKLVIVAIGGVALGMALFAWWARYSASQRVLERFGPEVAVAVRRGELVELWDVTASPTNPGETSEAAVPVSIGGADGAQTVYLSNRHDISKAAGLIHARHHLLHEKGFEWETSGDEAPPVADDRVWSAALRFTHEGTAATWLFDFQHRRAYLVERGAEIGMSPIAPSLQAFFGGLTRPPSE